MSQTTAGFVYAVCSARAYALRHTYRHLARLNQTCPYGCRDSPVGSGYYSDAAVSLGALQVWPEHRYYATKADYTPSLTNYDYLTVEQALVDHIEVVLHIQLRLNLDRAPVIAIGASYSK